MLNGSPRRTWALIGAAGTLVILAIGWFLFISSEKSSRSDLLDQAASTRDQAAITQSKIAALRKDNERLPTYKAQLAALAKALPVGVSTAPFVTDMQKLSTSSSVTITSINVTPPTTIIGSGTPQTVDGATALPITVAASGSPAHLEKFLHLLQASESRALLVGRVTESAPTGSTAGASPTLTVGMTAFFTTR